MPTFNDYAERTGVTDRFSRWSWNVFHPNPTHHCRLPEGIEYPSDPPQARPAIRKPGHGVIVEFAPNFHVPSAALSSREKAHRFPASDKLMPDHRYPPTDAGC